MVRTIIFSLWLPVLVLAASFVRFGFGAPADGPGLIGILMLIALTWPAAIPLTLAIRLINGRPSCPTFAPCYWDLDRLTWPPWAGFWGRSASSYTPSSPHCRPG